MVQSSVLPRRLPALKNVPGHSAVSHDKSASYDSLAGAGEEAASGALIVGGGPAGLAAAIALRQRGIACTVVEARGSGHRQGLRRGSDAGLAGVAAAAWRRDRRVGWVCVSRDPVLRIGLTRWMRGSLRAAGLVCDGRCCMLCWRLRAEALKARLLWESRVVLPSPECARARERRW